jgi:hypothetical protein
MTGQRRDVLAPGQPNGHRPEPEGPEGCPCRYVCRTRQAESDSRRLAIADLRFAAWFL